jgi:outer membrane protein assembly factor BamB
VIERTTPGARRNSNRSLTARTAVRPSGTPIIDVIARPLARLRPTPLLLAVLVAACSSTSSTPPSPTRSGGHRSSSDSPAALALRIRPTYRLPAPVEREVAVTDGGTVYLAGGLDSGGASVAGVFSMDPATGKVTSLGSMPNAFHDAAGAMLGGRLVVFGGGSTAGTDAVQAFDPASGKGSVIGHLPIALSDLQAAVVGDTVYLIGGYDGTSPRNEIYATTDGRRFHVVAHLTKGARYPAVAVVGSTIVIAGGETGSASASADIYAFDTASGKVRHLGQLPTPLADAAAFSLGGAVYVAGGVDASGAVLTGVSSIDPSTGSVTAQDPLHSGVSDAAVVQIEASALVIGGDRSGAVDSVLRADLEPVRTRTSPPPTSTSASPTTGSAAADVRPFAGLLLIADRGNNRLLVMNANKHIVWRYPSPNLPPPPFPFYFPDDAFWVHGGNAILVNEEENDVLAEIAYPSGETIWTYGHPRSPGSSRGYVHQPDDLYPYPGGGVVVADALNCRILFFGPAGNPSGQIGQTGNCTPGLPDTVGYPNGDTPLPNGHLLITQLHGGSIAEVTPTGHPIWEVHVPGITVPSDPQAMPDGSFLAVNYAHPGSIERFTSAGHVLWRYRPTSGRGELDHPSLAAPMPNGLIAVNDDYRHRVVLIDPATNRIVWQYGQTDHAGTAHGLLSYPDGLDLMLPGGAIPMHVDFATDQVRTGRP